MRTAYDFQFKKSHLAYVERGFFPTPQRYYWILRYVVRELKGETALLAFALN